MTDAEQIISQIVSEAELESKTVIGVGYHGSCKGDEIVYTVWYDPKNLIWTTKPEALKGHIFLKLSPIIRKVIKEHE